MPPPRDPGPVPLSSHAPHPLPAPGWSDAPLAGAAVRRRESARRWRGRGAGRAAWWGGGHRDPVRCARDALCPHHFPIKVCCGDLIRAPSRTGLASAHPNPCRRSGRGKWPPPPGSFLAFQHPRQQQRPPGHVLPPAPSSFLSGLSGLRRLLPRLSVSPPRVPRLKASREAGNCRKMSFEASF